ncbi:MAG: sarcosine oxidase subunit alpha family protein, partial [Candidatus Competibacteraceae bacterium]|nr:sarcosine oxidase subunit alpha family protein [Candidatus Competibacteraceae bacterium]
VPNLRATQTELYQGLTARNVTAWPSLKFDLMGINNTFSKLMPAGFYYKTFMWPKQLWMSYEHAIRKAAGLGEAPDQPDPDLYDKTNAHCDVLVVGAGPAGLAAALAAGRSGARVIICDEQNEFGGSLLGSRETLEGRPAADWVQEAFEELAALPEVRLLYRTTAFGYYDHNFLALVQRRTDHLPLGAGEGVRQRLWRVRAKRVVLATGAIERPLVLSNNDRPGVMLASSVSTYLNRFAVAPGRRAVVFTNNDGAYRTALDLLEAGVAVAAVVDSRRDPQGDLPRRVREKGVTVLDRHVVVDVQGSTAVEGVRVMALNKAGDTVVGSDLQGIGCDLLAVSGGWSPVVHLHSQSGAKAHWDEAKACFVPGQSRQEERSIGAANGIFELAGCLEEGFQAGAEAATLAGFKTKAPQVPAVETIREEALEPLWLVPAAKVPSRVAKQFVDFQNDTSAADIQLAVREGFRNVEHVKRYTALGFGTDQGKLGNINGMAILAKALGQSIPETGTTTFRPAYTPTTFGALAGRELGELFEPIRKTTLHQWHEAHGAEFENVGQWKRPWYYPRKGESIHDAVNRECLAARNSVGIMDASTLGKIDIQGPDAAEFLNRIYTNAWKKLPVGKARYGLMLKEDGMVFDDGVTVRLGENHYYMTTTTGGAAGVLNWLERWHQTEWPQLKVYFTSVTDHWSTMAVVGPNSRKVVSKICEGIDFSPEAFPFMSFQEGKAAGVPARVMRISFSGELAYEVNVNAHYGRHIWEALMEVGREYDITPYGTETMHVLRAEKGYIIVGQDTDGSLTPSDVNMGWAVAKNKDFIGKRSLSRPDTVREDRKELVGLLTEDPNEVLPEGGQIVDRDTRVGTSRGEPVPMVGHVTSSYYSANLGRSIALAVVKGGLKRMGETVKLPLVDGRTVKATIASSVFIDPEGARQNV